ncbi:MAG: tetratricopeptide repeat protein [Planctomycetota bacterium]
MPFSLLASTLVLLLAQEPKAPADALARARALVTKGELPAAVSVLTKAIADRPDWREVHLLRASCQERLRKFDSAEADYTQALELRDGDARVHLSRGSIRYFRGDVKGSIEDFDRVAELSPSSEPHLWQRGISYYEAGEFERGRKQFERHRKVNGNDVENSVWHMLCAARELGLDEAKKRFLTIEDVGGRFPDSRVPMKEIYALFAGTGTTEAVLAAAEALSEEEGPRRRRALQYAHLYIGLHHEMIGDPEKALGHLKKAAEDFFVPDYMGEVGRVHVARKEQGSQR